MSPWGEVSLALTEHSHGHLTPWAGQVPPTHAGSYSGPAVTPQVTFCGRELGQVSPY